MEPDVRQSTEIDLIEHNHLFELRSGRLKLPQHSNLSVGNDTSVQSRTGPTWSLTEIS